MNSLVVGGIARPLDHESIDEWIVETLCRRGPLTLDYLNSLFPKLEEARLLFAVDRLSRVGKIVIAPPHGGDYLISARLTEEVVADQGDSGSFVNSEELTVVCTQ